MINSTNSYTHHRVTLDRARQEVDYFELPEELKHKVVSAMEYQWKAMVPSRCSLIKDETLSPQLREEIVLPPREVVEQYRSLRRLLAGVHGVGGHAVKNNCGPKV